MHCCIFTFIVIKYAGLVFLFFIKHLFDTVLSFSFFFIESEFWCHIVIFNFIFLLCTYIINDDEYEMKIL